jgi:predicted cupin superfamily sugar epimerase
MTDWKELVETLRLEPHPEGGFYRETYRSAASTAIYYLLPAGAVSRLHRLKCDELFHFHAGGPMTIVELRPDGAVVSTRLAADAPQHVVRAGAWFGGFPEDGSAFSLVGCTVAPPFRFEEFELGERAALLARFPAARALIERLTP